MRRIDGTLMASLPPWLPVLCSCNSTSRDSTPRSIAETLREFNKITTASNPPILHDFPRYADQLRSWKPPLRLHVFPVHEHRLKLAELHPETCSTGVSSFLVSDPTTAVGGIVRNGPFTQTRFRRYNRSGQI